MPGKRPFPPRNKGNKDKRAQQDEARKSGNPFAFSKKK